MISLTVGCAMLLSPVVSSAASQSTNKFYVPINRSEIVSTKTDLGEVMVANPEVADIYVHGTNKVSVIGKALGQTSVRLFDENFELVRELDVYVTYDLPAIRKALHEFLPYERIGVEMINTKIALTGEASSASAAASAIEIASEFLAVGTEPTQPLDDERRTMVQNDIINLMKISAGHQVMLRIRIGEIQRGTLKQLGLGFEAIKGGGNIPFQILSSSSFGGLAGVTRAAAGYINGQNSVSAAIDALEQDNLLKILAEPNLVALSGEQAEFLAGGEIPIPVAQNDDTISLEFKPYGVSVRFIPYVLSENRIRIQVEPEVSERNDGDGINIGGGVTVPSFDVRRVNTTVELAPGESFMIAGLMQDSLRSQIDQLPGVSEIPILSSLFRSTGYDRTETELVMAVTPYIVDPLKSSDVRLPTDDFRPASFMESIFYGALSSLQGNSMRLSQTPSLEGPIGFMVD